MTANMYMLPETATHWRKAAEAFVGWKGGARCIIAPREVWVLQGWGWTVTAGRDQGVVGV